MKITLTILKEDIEEGNYTNADICPITKALRRAGYPNLRDEGINIVDETGKAVCKWENNSSYAELSRTIANMDSYVWKKRFNEDTLDFPAPETFTVTIEVSDPSDMKPEVDLVDAQDFMP